MPAPVPTPVTEKWCFHLLGIQRGETEKLNPGKMGHGRALGPLCLPGCRGSSERSQMQRCGPMQQQSCYLVQLYDSCWMGSGSFAPQLTWDTAGGPRAELGTNPCCSTASCGVMILHLWCSSHQASRGQSPATNTTLWLSLGR